MYNVCTLFRNMGFMLDEMFQRKAQNLPYFWNMKTHVCFIGFHFVLLYFSLMNALVYVNIELGKNVQRSLDNRCR